MSRALFRPPAPGNNHSKKACRFPKPRSKTRRRSIRIFRTRDNGRQVPWREHPFSGGARTTLRFFGTSLVSFEIPLGFGNRPVDGGRRSFQHVALPDGMPFRPVFPQLPCTLQRDPSAPCGHRGERKAEPPLSRYGQTSPGLKASPAIRQPLRTSRKAIDPGVCPGGKWPEAIRSGRRPEAKRPDASSTSGAKIRVSGRSVRRDLLSGPRP